MSDLVCFHCGDEASRVYFYRKAYAPDHWRSAEDPRLCCEPCWQEAWHHRDDQLGHLYPHRGGWEQVATWPFSTIAEWDPKIIAYVTSRKFSEFNHFHLSEQWSKRLWHIHFRYRASHALS